MIQKSGTTPLKTNNSKSNNDKLKDVIYTKNMGGTRFIFMMKAKLND